jgi:hypothetical protein
MESVSLLENHGSMPQVILCSVLLFSIFFFLGIRRIIRVSNRRWRCWVMTQRCQWHCWVKSQWCHSHRWVKTKRCCWHRCVSKNLLLYMIWHRDSAVSLIQLSQSSAVSLTPLSQNSAVSLTSLSQHRHCWVNLRNLKRLSDLLKRKWNQNLSKDELYYPRPLRQKL